MEATKKAFAEDQILKQLLKLWPELKGETPLRESFKEKYRICLSSLGTHRQWLEEMLQLHDGAPVCRLLPPDTIHLIGQIAQDVEYDRQLVLTRAITLIQMHKD